MKDIVIIILIILAINWAILPFKMDKQNDLLQEILKQLQKNQK